MDVPSHVPAGYCPYCGYRIDPGRCSECGRDVPEAELARMPPRLARRRIVRRIAVLMVVLIAIGAGYQVPWMELPPTNWLLALQGTGPGPVTRELARRWNSGLLSPAEETRMACQGTAVDPVLRAKNTGPAGFPVAAELWMTNELGLSLQFDFDLVEVRVDGEPHRSKIGPVAGSGTSNNRSNLRFTFRGLSPGRHWIEVCGDARTTKFGGAPAFTPGVVVPFYATLELDLVEVDWERLPMGHCLGWLSLLADSSIWTECRCKPCVDEETD